MSGTTSFYEADFWATLFPLKTNLLMMQHHEKDLSQYVYQRVLSEAHPEDNFLPQQRVYAIKPRSHLRRTLKLDPVADYFLYDLAYRNRSIFRKPVSSTREAFGYRFEEGHHIGVNTAYRAYKARIRQCKKDFKHFISFDIAAYFNSLYHHDVCHWFESRDGVTTEDAAAFGKFCREINAGRSIDFLPQGLYPAKMVGSEFLKFIDLSGQIKSTVLLRFMDDIYLFDDTRKTLAQDFVRIQQLLGNKALNINAAKTKADDQTSDIARQISQIRKALFEVVELVEEPEIEGSGNESPEQTEILAKHLSQDQINTLIGFLRDDNLEEVEAELILNFLRSHTDSVLDLVPALLKRFPNITKFASGIFGSVQDKEALAKIVLDYIKPAEGLLEFQLFWLAILTEEHLLETDAAGDILMSIYEQSTESKVARAKVLEIPAQDFGLKELRDEHLKTGASDWLAWASAFGTRSLKPAERNHQLDYFSKGSMLNYLIASCVKKL
jgi:hypothetical protein